MDFRIFRRSARKTFFLIQRPTVPVVMNMGDVEPLCEGLSQENLENVSAFRGDVNILRAEKGEEAIELGVAMKYLKATQYDANRAMDIYNNYQKYRESNQLDSMKVHREPLCSEIGSRKMEIIGTYDGEGSPLVLFTGAKHDIKRSESKAAMQLLFYILDQVTECEQNQESGVVFLMDLRDTSVTATSYISNILSVLRDGYPLYLKSIYFIDTPTVIKKSPAVVRFLKQEGLKAKQVTYSTLSTHFDLAQLPLSLGGIFTPGKEPTYPFCSIKTTRPMAKRNRIFRPETKGSVNESSLKTVDSLTRMFDSKPAHSVTESPSVTSSHKPLPPTPLKPKFNSSPPTPPVKPSKSLSSEANKEEHKRISPLIPPPSPKVNGGHKKPLCASLSHPDMLNKAETSNKQSPPAKKRGFGNFFRRNKETETESNNAPKRYVKGKSPKVDTKTTAAPSVSNTRKFFSSKSSDEAFTTSWSPSGQQKQPRGRMDSDDDKSSRTKKLLIPVKMLKGEDQSIGSSRGLPVPPPQHSPPNSSNMAEHEDVSVTSLETTGDSSRTQTRSSDHTTTPTSGCEYENVTIRGQTSNDKNRSSKTNSNGSVDPSPQHNPREYQNVILLSNSSDPVPTNHRHPVPTTAAPTPPVYSEVGPKSTPLPAQGAEYEEVRFTSKPISKASSEDGYISDDDTLFGKEGPPGLQAVIYANFGPDEGNKLMNVEELEKHISSKGINGLAEEYIKIKNEPLSGRYTVCRFQYNLPKNRYKDVVCFDETRVKLRPIKGIEGSDYIHANYVSGYNKPEAFILTQGPKDKTVVDFWRLVWEKQVHVIVMVTKCVEMMKRKCAQYWPEKVGTVVNHRNISVEVLKIDTASGFEQRTIKVAMKGSGERIISHFQFLAWPDYGVPKSGSSVLDLLSTVREVQAQVAKGSRDFKHRYGPPILVHCSAGVGRSGAFCTLDIAIDELADKRKVNIQGIVRKMRLQRAYSIQTEEQYEFCYRTLLEYATNHT